MTHCVLDSSSALALVLPDEDDASAFALAKDIAAAGAIVPPVWPLEIANGLLMAERRARMTGDERRDAISALMALPIKFDDQKPEWVWTTVTDLAASARLTTYDASYLSAALRHGLPLATRDEKLRKAAEIHGVHVIDR